MENSGHAESDVPEENLASGYTRRWDERSHEKEPRRSNIHTRPARGSSAGGGCATARDLVRFVSAVRSGNLVGPAGWLSGPAATTVAKKIAGLLRRVKE